MNDAAAQAAANLWLNNTISDLPKFYGTAKNTITAKVGTVFENLKMATVEVPMKIAAKINSSFSQLQEMIPRGQNVQNIKILQDLTLQTDAVCEGPGDNQAHNQGKPTCWYCHIPGHRQEDCRKRIKENKPCIGLKGSTYWPKPKQSPIKEEEEGQGSQGAIGEMYTGQLASIFLVFQ